jgi:hypothetical protein
MGVNCNTFGLGCPSFWESTIPIFLSQVEGLCRVEVHNPLYHTNEKALTYY